MFKWALRAPSKTTVVVSYSKTQGGMQANHTGRYKHSERETGHFCTVHVNHGLHASVQQHVYAGTCVIVQLAIDFCLGQSEHT